MKSWLNSLNLKLIQQVQICYSEGNFLLIRSTDGSFFAVISLPALRLRRCHCSVATCSAAATADVGCCTQQCWEDMEGLFKHMMDEICQACFVSNEGKLKTQSCL